ncbi:hypothetical protein C8034_v002435 [Colletotrichum sidae]|nr:hypothetical protein C8035_v007982 [Colletotrichum spinosum]TEA15269.1 hypothetical protein C8034_v002435 [Colletotrichum sidae]
MTPTPEYQPFLKYSDDPATEEPTANLQPVVRRRSTIISHILVFVGTSLLWALAVYLLVPWPMTSPGGMSSAKASGNHVAGQRHNVTSNRRLIMCGNTTAEARANGCKYDILLNHWVPAACFDRNSVEEYREDESWGAYADINMTQRLTVDEMSERDFYWTSIRDHVNHCAIMWRRQFYALYDERPAIDSIVTSPGHTEHCSQYLMDVVDAKWTEPTKTMRGFAGCWMRE